MAWKPQNFASDMSVPSTFSSIRQHSIYNSPVGELLCSVCPLIPLCPVLLIFIHQFVYTTQGSGRKGQKYLLRHTAWSCWGCQMTELTGLCLMTSWMLLSSTSPASVPLLSFLLILTKGLRSETFAICPNWKRASSPTLPLQSPLWNGPSPKQAQLAPDTARVMQGMGSPTSALLSAHHLLANVRADLSLASGPGSTAFGLPGGASLAAEVHCSA